MFFFRRLTLFVLIIFNSHTGYSGEPEWIINPYDPKENPLFHGGPSLFASSRMGQVHMPGMALGILQPLYAFSAQTMAPRVGRALADVSKDYIAHIAWRLGCDQGYRGGEELVKNEYPSLSAYFNGFRDPKHQHPILAHQMNQTITPLALLFFGAGQVIGQRFFGPFLKQQLMRVGVFNKSMRVSTSGVMMDVYGWPVYGAQFTRAESIGKIGGILVGSYLGWSLNDVGWQIANWRKFSFDSFSEYMPYYGNENFGNIDKGWGILGFTIGGFMGHNLGATLADSILARRSVTNGFAKGVGRHAFALSGNLLLGLGLTTYFPHLFKKIFNLYPQSAMPTIKEVDVFDYDPITRDRMIKKIVDEAIDHAYLSFVQNHMAALAQASKSVAVKGSGIQSFRGPHHVPAEYKVFLRTLTELMARKTSLFITQAESSLGQVTTFTALKKWVRFEFMSLIPEAMVLSRSKMSRDVLQRLSPNQDLSLYKKRFLGLIIHLYPLIYKFRFVAAIKRLDHLFSAQYDPLLDHLMFQRGLVTVALQELFAVAPLKAEQIRLKFFELHRQLVSNKKLYNQKNGAPLIQNYLEGLSDLNKQIASELRK